MCSWEYTARDQVFPEFHRLRTRAVYRVQGCTRGSETTDSLPDPQKKGPGRPRFLPKTKYTHDFNYLEPACKADNISGNPVCHGYILLKNYKAYMQSLTDTIRQFAKDYALQAGRPYEYKSSSSELKINYVRSLLERDPIQGELIMTTALNLRKTDTLKLAA